MSKHNIQRSQILPLIILFFLFLALGLLLYQRLTATPGRTARIYQNGILVRDIRLDKVKQPYTFSLEAPDGGYNVIRVEPGKIGVVKADCPDQICKQMGMISDSTRPIACLPHLLVIRIEDETSGQESLDSIA